VTLKAKRCINSLIDSFNYAGHQVRGSDMTAHLLDKTWDMQWKVVRRIAECLGYVRCGSMQASCKGRASITFSKGGMRVMEDRLSSCSMREQLYRGLYFVCVGRPSRESFVEFDCSSCLIANMRS
jgi:hypothetical protein